MTKDDVIIHLQILWTWNEVALGRTQDEAEKKERARTAEWIMDALELLKEEKTGHWLVLTARDVFGVYCSECNTKIFDYSAKPKNKLSRYCPNCGVKMAPWEHAVWR